MKSMRKAIMIALFVVGGIMITEKTEAEPAGEVPVRNEEFVAIVEKEIVHEVQQNGKREKWLDLLIMCESSGNPNAINEVDLDGTPSYGILQFKPSTFAMFSKAYGIDGELMDPEAQKKIVRRMMDDPSVVWENQFPACVRKLGIPPQI